MSFGPYCRLESTSQRKEEAVRQVSLGEIGGHVHPANPGMSCIRAYPRRLHAGERGITFTTRIAPDPRFSAPHELRWYFPGTPDAPQRSDALGAQVAAIAAVVTNLQP